MKTRTQKEVDAEIKALEASKAWAPHYTAFNDDNWRNIDLQIEFLKGDIDTTAAEFYEMTDDEQSAVCEAENWLKCDSEESPSSGWDIFKKQHEQREKRKS